MNGSNGRDRHFTESQIEKWLKDFKIAPENSQVFSVGLEIMAENWTNECKAENPKTSTNSRKVELDRLRRHAAALKATLKNLSPSAWSDLEHTSDVMETSDRVEGIVLDWDDGTDARVPRFNLGPTSDSFGLDTLLATLGMIQSAASFPELTFDHIKTGAQPDRFLQIGMRHLHEFWEKTVGCEFTRDATSDGQPISEAARFCVQVCGEMSPNTPKSRVLNAMKKQIKQHREMKSRKNFPAHR